jgi:nitric oxide reductase NorQ protein
MIGEMVAAQATLREAISISLQTNKEILESILISLQLEKGYVEKGDSEYMLFTKDVVLKHK